MARRGVTAGSTPATAATTSTTGVIKLAQDLGGTGALPTVVAVTGAGGFVPVAATGNIIQWATATTAPGISQADNVTNSATGAAISIRTANCTGTSATSGALNLGTGTGTTVAGNVVINPGGTTVITVSPSNVLLSQPIQMAASAAASGDIRVGTAQWTIKNLSGSTTQQVLSCFGGTCQLGDNTVGSWTIATSSGGTAFLARTGGTDRLSATATEITTGASLVTGFLTQAMADAAQVVSAANSVNHMIRCTGANTGVRALTLTTTPTAGKMKVIRNDCTSFGITVQFSSGSATGTIAPGTSALVCGDGTNAFIMMTGT